MIPKTMLLAASAFGARLNAERVASALAAGLAEGGMPEPDLCPIVPEREGPGAVPELLNALGFDARMRGARALIVAVRRMEERALLGSTTFEIASRARQAGVPVYAVTAENALDPFDARMLDLQVILQARSARALVAAGRRLAGLA